MSRKLISRLLVGAGLLAAISVIVLLGSRATVAALAALWSMLATLEFTALLARAEIRLNRLLLCTLNAATIGAAYLNWLPGFIIAPLALTFIAGIARPTPLPRIPVYGSFTVIYLGFLPAHLVMLRNAADSMTPWLVFFPLVLTWTNDTAAYAFGKLLGRHRLAPQISPKKTVEGLIAGLVASALLAALWLSRLEPFSSRSVWWLAAVGMGLGALAHAGDLFESVFKRAVGIKDTSTIFGEHGGFLDRADSLLFVIPAFYYLLLAFR
ncbi:MAG: phosphatidate cytidylyltransferase [candidate division WOR-3 bacterium]